MKCWNVIHYPISSLSIYHIHSTHPSQSNASSCVFIFEIFDRASESRGGFIAQNFRLCSSHDKLMIFKWSFLLRVQSRRYAGLHVSFVTRIWILITQRKRLSKMSINTFQNLYKTTPPKRIMVCCCSALPCAMPCLALSFHNKQQQHRAMCDLHLRLSVSIELWQFYATFICLPSL